MSLLRRLIFGEGKEGKDTVTRESYPTYPTYPALPSKEAPSVLAFGAPHAYRETLRHWWALTAQGAGADFSEVERVYQEIVRLLDEVGEPTATRQRREWAHQWHRETGRCPFCGELGVFHEPEGSRER